MQDGFQQAITALMSDEGSLKELIQDAEILTAQRPDDPTPNYFLADAYQRLSEELPQDFRESLERAKLRLTGKEYLLDLPRDLRGYGKVEHINCMAVNMEASTAYMERAGAETYIHSGNAMRAALNLKKAVEKSGDNPVYKDARYALLWGFALDERLHRTIEVIDPKFDNMLTAMAELGGHRS